MIGMTVGKCRVDILPVVNGLASEAEKVKQAYGGRICRIHGDRVPRGPA